jgi:hypothetical protein
MRCQNCGASITATIKKKWNKRIGEFKTYTYYHCTRRIGIDSCKEPALTLNELEDQIENILAKYSIDEDVYNLAMKVLTANLKQDTSENEAILNKQRAFIRATQAKLDKLLHLLLNDIISEEEYSKQKRDLEQKIALMNIKVENPGNSTMNPNEEIKKVFHYCHYGIYALKNGDLKTKRGILSALGSNHRITAKNLYIDVHEWLIAIKNCENDLRPVITRLELEKASNDNVESLFFKYSSLMCGAIDNVRTKLKMLPNTPYIPNEITNSGF